MFCTNQVVKFGGGYLYCQITISSSDSLLEENNINQLRETINRLPNTDEISKYNPRDLSENPSTTGKYTIEGIFCAVNIRKIKPASKNYNFEINCSEKSKRSFYPYRN